MPRGPSPFVTENEFRGLHLVFRSAVCERVVNEVSCKCDCLLSLLLHYLAEVRMFRDDLGDELFGAADDLRSH